MNVDSTSFQFASNTLQLKPNLYMAPSNFIVRETPSGSVNGVNTTFNLAATPNPGGSEQVFVNGVLQDVTNDYTISTNVITFLTGAIPQTGDKVRVTYMNRSAAPA